MQAGLLDVFEIVGLQATNITVNCGNWNKYPFIFNLFNLLSLNKYVCKNVIYVMYVGLSNLN